MLTRSMISPQCNMLAAGPATLSRLNKQKVHGQIAQHEEDAAEDGESNHIIPQGKHVESKA